MRKLFLMVMVCALLAVFPVALAEQPAQAAPGALLSVSGSAVVTLQPDYATLNLGVSTQAETVADAQAQNASQMNALLTALEGAGVAKEDIQTQYFSINPVYGNINNPMEMTTYPMDGGKPVGYRVENNLQVTLRKIDSLGSTLDVAMQAGANQSYGLSFESTQRAEAYDKALQEAVKEAQRKAQLMAAASGKELGALETLTEQGEGYSGPYMKTMALEADRSTPIVSGTITVEATVQAEYRMP